MRISPKAEWTDGAQSQEAELQIWVVQNRGPKFMHHKCRICHHNDTPCPQNRKQHLTVGGLEDMCDSWPEVDPNKEAILKAMATSLTRGPIKRVLASQAATESLT